MASTDWLPTTREAVLQMAMKWNNQLAMKGTAWSVPEPKVTELDFPRKYRHKVKPVKKQFFGILGIIALATLIGFVFVGCDNGNGDTKPRDPIFLSNDASGTIPIYYLDGVTKAQAETIRGYIDVVYGAFIPAGQDNWKDGRVTRINVTTGADVNKDGTILNIGYQIDPVDLQDAMGIIIASLHLDNSKETVRLA